jgi:hypothetical protein
MRNLRFAILVVILVFGSSSAYNEDKEYAVLYCECETCLEEIQKEPSALYP